MFDTVFITSEKVDIVKALELFNYLKNYQSYVIGSGILLPTGNRSSPGYVWQQIFGQ